MMKILLAVDESPHSAAAVDEVLRRPWPAGTIVRLVTVSAFSYIATEPWFAVGWEGFDAEAKNRAEALIARIASRFSGTDLPVDTAVREGDPRMLIVDEAKNWDADLVVLGSHGYSGIRRLLLGSVAQYVVSHAPCSVEVVRRKEGSA